MRSLLVSVCFLFFVFGTLDVGVAQITITAADVAAQLAPGHTLTTRVDTSTKTVDIGSLGATSWDFSSIVTNYSIVSSTVKPDTTPYFSDFPAATHAYKIGTIYSYYDLGADLLLLGTAFSSPFTARQTNTPPQVLYDLPMTIGTTWTTTYAETSKISSPAITTVTNFIRENVVDAYGNLTLPGGAVYAAIRLRVDTRAGSGFSYVRSIQYYYIAQNGAQVAVTAADTNQPNVGTISVSNTTWNGPIIATRVEEIPGDGLPAKFELQQNYPNPFNPSTTIRFSIERSAMVNVKIFNMLGEEIGKLVSQELAPGSYSVVWDAAAFPSGVYMCRLQSGSLVETKKLLLAR